MAQFSLKRLLLAVACIAVALASFRFSYGRLHPLLAPFEVLTLVMPVVAAHLLWGKRGAVVACIAWLFLFCLWPLIFHH